MSARCQSDDVGSFPRTDVCLEHVGCIRQTPPGILQGNIRWIGRYDLCRDIKASLTQRDFNGRYCLTMSTAVNKSRTLLPEIGVCVPNSCSADVVNQLILSGVLGTDVLDIPKYNPNTICITDPEYSAGAIAALCICSILGLLIVGGTGISVFKYLRKTIFSTDEDDKDGILNQSATQSGDSNRTESENMKDTVKGLGVIENTLSCFCAITNGRKILAIQKSGPYSHLAALNGIRVLSMFWLILFHTHQFIPEFTDNPHEVTSVYQRFSGQVIANLTATLSVDSFFVLSGMLVTYLTLNKLEKRAGQLNWAVFYFHRFWRLTPVYMIIIMLWATMRPYFTNGPLYWTMNIDYPIDNCRKYWWTNLLYINNLYPYYLHEGCMTWGWYLANDMQFYIISSLIIYFLYRYSKIGYAIIGALMTACFTSLVVVYMKYDLRKNPEQLDKVITLTYIRPWSRINSYLVGMIVGYVLYEMPRKRWKISKLGALLGWCCAIATGLGTVYGLYRTPQGIPKPNLKQYFTKLCLEHYGPRLWDGLRSACAIGKGALAVVCKGALTFN
ncbi:nose resistant to fluoxetine protein 6-like [Amphiura filiformis]|uniref:nose resistant to fluoxetine protein 6-like n=1 Tax=Amphiura filiformis TaxID=82378 RepID=UPI003B21C952